MNASEVEYIRAMKEKGRGAKASESAPAHRIPGPLRPQVSRTWPVGAVRIPLQPL